ncbi:MAG: SHOCT domain-containing protein [Acidimicrobiia bacterium]|nr:SHOCT domain-containing protein [Acidimicrobiia bacterium]
MQVGYEPPSTPYWTPDQSGWIPRNTWETRLARPPTSSAGDRIERFSQLADLRGQGAISEAEFEAEKRKLLD